MGETNSRYDIAKDTEPKNKGGRPRKVAPDDFIARAEKWIVENDKEGTKPTMSGLAGDLGYDDRSAMYDALEDERFRHTIKRCLRVIEKAHEFRMFNTQCVGSIFVLKNMGHAGWRDSQDLHMSGSVTSITRAELPAKRKKDQPLEL